jgi:hypothetical protein
LLHLLAQAVALDAGGAHVDHVAYARHGQRSFGHVGGQHDTALAFGVEHPLLLGLAEAGKQRQHLGIAQRGLVAQVFGQVVGRFADFTLAWQKHQNVAARSCAAAPQLVYGIGHRVIQVFRLSPLLLWRFFAIVFCTTLRIVERAVTYFNREGAARHHQHGRGLALGIGKVVGKPVGIDGGRRDDQLQIRPFGQQLAQKAEQKVDVQAALVRLVDDERVVPAQHGVRLRFGQQNAIGHQLDAGTGREAVVETHLVAHHLAQRRVQLIGNALGHAGGRDAPGLCVANDGALPAQLAIFAWHLLALGAAQGQRHFGQLRGFARAGFTTHDDHLVPHHGRHDFVTAGGNGQGLGKFNLQLRPLGCKDRRGIGCGHGVRLSRLPLHVGAGPTVDNSLH